MKLPSEWRRVCRSTAKGKGERNELHLAKPTQPDARAKTKGAAKYIRDCRRRNKQLAAKQRKIIAALEAEQKEMNEFDCACAFMQLPVHERLAMRSAITETAATVGRMSHAMDQLEHSDIHFAAVASVFPPAKETK